MVLPSWSVVFSHEHDEGQSAAIGGHATEGLSASFEQNAVDGISGLFVGSGEQGALDLFAEDDGWHFVIGRDGFVEIFHFGAFRDGEAVQGPVGSEAPDAESIAIGFEGKGGVVAGLHDL